MTEADTKDGLDVVCGRFDEILDVFDRFGAHDGIAGAVAQEQTVVLALVQLVIPGNEIDACTAIHQASDLVVFQTAVDSANPRGSFRIECLHLLLQTKNIQNLLEKNITTTIRLKMGLW